MKTSGIKIICPGFQNNIGCGLVNVIGRPIEWANSEILNMGCVSRLGTRRHLKKCLDTLVDIKLNFRLSHFSSLRATIALKCHFRLENFKESLLKLPKMAF